MTIEVTIAYFFIAIAFQIVSICFYPLVNRHVIGPAQVLNNRGSVLSD